MYIGSSINESPVIAVTVPEAIPASAMLAVTMSKTGVAVAKKGEAAIGILLAETDALAAGDTATVQVKDIALWIAGAAVEAGDLLASDENGKAVKATDGDFIVAQALEAATAADQAIKVQVIKAGYAGSGGSAGGDIDSKLAEYQKKITANGILKGDGNGTITAASAGVDYATPTD